MLLSLKRHPILGLIQPRIAIHMPAAANQCGGEDASLSLVLTAPKCQAVAPLVIPVVRRRVAREEERRDQRGELRAVGGAEAAAWLQARCCLCADAAAQPDLACHFARWHGADTLTLRLLFFIENALVSQEVTGVACIMVEAADYWRMHSRGRAEGERCPSPGAGPSLHSEAPLLVVGEASVAELNARLGAAGVPLRVGAGRFRPNLVAAGCEQHAEDTWEAVELLPPEPGPPGCPQAVVLRLEMRGQCGRCDLINVGDPGEAAQPATGGGAAGAGSVETLWPSLRHDGAAAARSSNSSSSREPLATLAGYRRVAGRVRFGAYAEPALAEAEGDLGAVPNAPLGAAALAAVAGEGLRGWVGVGFQIVATGTAKQPDG